MQALRDEVFYPVPLGKIENIIIKRGLSSEGVFTQAIAESENYRGALADCLISLVQAVNFSEADKSVGSLTESQREAFLKRANKLYISIGEEEQDVLAKPMVYIGG